MVDNYVLDTAGPFAGADIDPASLEVELDEPPSTAAEPTPPVPEEQQREVLPNSVAVLLCANLSPDPNDAYFAASIHEEILNQLYKIRALNVIARTSVLQYADAPPPISQIAEELNVGAVVECSVRYAGDAILVTAQLIDPETNSHLWSDTYPGDLSDLSTVFAMQADIAMNIANAVGAEFSLEEQQRIEEIPTDSPEAYALYLRANSLFVESTTGTVNVRDQVEPLLLEAIDLDPDFALAYGWLAYSYASAREEGLTLEYAEKALELDSDLGIAYAAISGIYYLTNRFEEALEFAEQAYQRSPTVPYVGRQYVTAMVAMGRQEEAVRLVERATELDPANAAAYYGLGLTRWDAGDRIGGIVAVRRAVELAPGRVTSRRGLGMMEAALGNRAEGVDQFRFAERLVPDEPPNVVVAFMYRVVGLHDDAARIARAHWASGGASEASQRARPADRLFYHVALDEEVQALDALQQLVESPPGAFGLGFTWIMTNPYDDPMLDKPEFQALRAELRAKFGWN